MSKVGTVYIVGAGPGDPKLLTLRAAEVLREADVVLYDRLVNPSVLEFASKAVHIYAGKELGIDSNGRQQAIIRELIDHAQQGKIVVRLKGGDPFVFGRGGEEALALAEEGVPFEIVPGISSCIAVPASALIPVTHRGVSAAFAVFAGQTEHYGLSDDMWKAAAAIPTAVFLMGVERLPLIVQNLLMHGRKADTQVAIIANGTLPNETVVTGTLADIVDQAKGLYPPCIIVVGPTVGVREQLLELEMEKSVSY